MTQWGLDTLFNPAKRHMDEEKRRLQTTREQLGDSSGGKRIDLESGKVTIRRRSDAETEDTGGDTDTDTDTDTGADAATDTDTDADGANAAAGAPDDATAPSTAADAGRQLTPAQIRAARRRGREPR